VQIDFISSIAQPIVLGSVLLDGTPYTSTSTSATADTFFGGAGFQSVSSFLWTDLPGNAASYTLNLQTFTTSVPPGIESSALTALAIDTSVTAVPEPAAVGVVAVGALLVRRRR